MNERIAQYRGRLTQFWGQMGRKQKIWLGASISGLLLTIILLTIVFTRTEYEIAFQNLDTTDAAAIMTYLDGSGIPYRAKQQWKKHLGSKHRSMHELKLMWVLKDSHAGREVERARRRCVIGRRDCTPVGGREVDGERAAARRVESDGERGGRRAPVPSVTVTSLIDSAGSGSSSVIVPIAWPSAMVEFVAFRLRLTKNVSFGSSSGSP